MDQNSQVKMGLSFFEKLKRRKLRNYLFLNTKLQFNFALLLAIVGLFTAGYFVALFYLYTKDTMMQLANYVPDYLLTERFMNDSYKRFTYTVCFAMIGEFVFVLLLGLFFSHRVAGPLFAVSQRLKTIAEGKVPEKLMLRRNDFLDEFAADLNNSIEALESQKSQIKSALDDLKNGNQKSCEDKLKKFT